MGKKAKKQQKRRAKVASKVDKWVSDAGLSEQELMMAGLGVMAKAVEQGQKKLFDRAMKAGRRVAEIGVPSLDTTDSPEAPSDVATEPVISYQARGGGWYTIEIDGTEVDRVQGEAPAAERAGALLTNYAALDSATQKKRQTGIDHVGGGWYKVTVSGVPVDRVRGKDEVEARFGDLVS